MPADSERIAEINVASWRAAYEGLLAPETLAAMDAPKLAVEWRAAIEVPERPKVRLWVAEDGDEVIGYSRTGPSRDADAPDGTAEVYGFYLHPDSWGRGAGRALMNHVLADFASSGFKEATLWVVDRNERARGFYEKTGWTYEPGPTNTCFGAPEVRYRRPLT